MPAQVQLRHASGPSSREDEIARNPDRRAVRHRPPVNRDAPPGYPECGVDGVGRIAVRFDSRRPQLERRNHDVAVRGRREPHLAVEGTGDVALLDRIVEHRCQIHMTERHLTRKRSVGLREIDHAAPVDISCLRLQLELRVKAIRRPVETNRHCRLEREPTELGYQSTDFRQRHTAGLHLQRHDRRAEILLHRAANQQRRPRGAQDQLLEIQVVVPDGHAARELLQRDIGIRSHARDVRDADAQMDRFVLKRERSLTPIESLRDLHARGWRPSRWRRRPRCRCG